MKIPNNILKVTRPIVNTGSVIYKLIALGSLYTMAFAGVFPTWLAIGAVTAHVLHVLGKLSKRFNWI